jgi:hypothetical protein
MLGAMGAVRAMGCSGQALSEPEGESKRYQSSPGDLRRCCFFSA